MKSQKTLIFYTIAGGGHYAAAKSLKESMDENFANKSETILLDGLEESAPWVKDIFRNGYTKMVGSFDPFFSLISLIGRSKLIGKSVINLLNISVKPYIRKKILEEKPTKLVTTHYFTKAIQEILEEEGLNIPVFTVVTDNFTPHSIWFAPKGGNWILLSKRAKERALKKGIKKKNIKIFEGFVNRKFNQKMPEKEKIEFKKKIGLDERKPTILMTGGGLGLKKGDKILENLLKKKLDINIIFIYGKNKTLETKVNKIVENYPDSSIKIYSFVDFIYELMNVADLVISKSGPASVIETLLLEKPLILTHYIWEQEKGNMEFVVKNKVGFYETEPVIIVKKIEEIMTNPKTGEKLKENLKKLDLRNEIDEATEYIFRY